MTAAAASQPGPERPPFADASPARIRAALTPEDAASFDRQWRALMARATEQLDLTAALIPLAEAPAMMELTPWSGHSVNYERDPDAAVRNSPSGPAA